MVDSTDGTLTLTNCTISGNSANDGTGGGVETDGTTSITNCTISGNYGVLGGGVFNNATGNSNNVQAELTNTIVAGNIGESGDANDIGGNLNVASSSSYNLIGAGGSGGIQGGIDGNTVLTSLVGLGLAPLGDYGGPTLTMAPSQAARRSAREMLLSPVSTSRPPTSAESPLTRPPISELSKARASTSRPLTVPRRSQPPLAVLILTLWLSMSPPRIPLSRSPAASLRLPSTRPPTAPQQASRGPPPSLGRTAWPKSVPRPISSPGSSPSRPQTPVPQLRRSSA